MNFSFGNGGDNTGIIKNLSFSNNIVNSESTGVVFACLGKQGSENISICNNNINWKYIGNQISYQGIIENSQTTNLKLFNNKINCTSQEESSGYLYSFATNAEFYNNIIDINIDLVSLSADRGNIFKDNIINLNSDINFLYDGYEFTNNNVNINGEIGKIIDSTPVIFRFYSKTINNNINITNNNISINCKETSPLAIFFMYKSYINGWNIDFSDNIINSAIQRDNQELMHLQLLEDANSQKIYLNNTNSRDYKKIVFYENNVNPIVMVNDRKITSSKKVENFYL